MVQTRKEQLDIINAYWRKVTYVATGGSLSTTVDASTIHSAAITDLSTGSTTTTPPTRGIITSGSLNFCQVRNADNRKPFDNDSIPVYARITFSSPNYVISYYTKVAGAEVATALPGTGSINVELLFPEVLRAGEVPADAHLVDEGGFAGGGAGGGDDDDGYFIGVAPRHEEATVTIEGQTAFSLADTPSDASHVMMFVNGVKQDYADEYTVSGTSVTYTGSLTLQTTDVIEFFYFVVSDISGGGGGVTDHGDLSGLSDDDHLQYLLINGTRAMTGSLNMGNNNITNVGGSNAATVGAIRMANNVGIFARNSGNDANASLALFNSSNVVHLADTEFNTIVNGDSTVQFAISGTVHGEVGADYLRIGNSAFATSGTIRTENNCSWTARNAGNSGNVNVIGFVTGILDIGDNANTGGATIHDGTQFEISINSSIKLHVDSSDVGLALPLAIGSSIANPATSASIDLQHTNRALLVNRLTTTNRDALTAADGMIIYNTTDSQLQGRINGSWVSLQGGVSDHGGLTGLSDDDHVHYLLINGTRAMTGNLSMGGHNITTVSDISNSGDIDFSIAAGSSFDFNMNSSEVLSIDPAGIITALPLTRANDAENTDVFLSPTHTQQGSGFNQGTSVTMSIVLTSGKDYDITITARVTDTSGNSVYKKSFYVSCYRTSGGTAAIDDNSIAVETNALFTCTASIVGVSLIVTLSNVTGGNNRVYNLRAGYNYGDMPNV